MFRILIVTATLVMLLPRQATLAQTNSDERAVHQTVLNYVDALYQGNVEQLRASVHKDIRKTGFLRAEGQAEYHRQRSNRRDLETYARAVQAGGAFSADADKEIAVLDVQNQTAIAKLTAIWGTEYLILVKEEGEWVVMTVVWEGPSR